MQKDFIEIERCTCSIT